jgi:hypothetical protein
MMKYFRESLIITVSGLFFFVASCTPLSCFEETESYVKASFYNNTTKLIQAPDSISLYGLGNENLFLYKKALRVQPVLFALNPSADSCTFILKINDKTDTITFRYTSFPHLVSKECGYTFYYTFTEDPVHTSNAIKSILKTTYNITTLNGENLKIYY